MPYSILFAIFLVNSLQPDGDRTILSDEDVRPNCMHLSRDGKTLAISGGTQKGGDWKIFDLTLGKCIVNGMNGKLRCGGAWSVCLSHDGALIAVGGNGPKFYLANAKTGELVWDMSNAGYVGVIRQSFFTSDDKYLVCVGDITIRIWDIENRKAHAVFRFTSTNPRLNWWQDPSLKEPAKLVYNFDGKYNFVGRCAPSRDRKTLAVAGNLDGKVPFVDLGTGKVVKTIDIKQPVTASVQFTADGKWLIVGGKESVEIWDVEKGKLVTLIDSKRSIHLTASPDKRILITGGGDGFRAWDIATGKQKYSYFSKEDPRMPKIKAYSDGSKAVDKETSSAGVAFFPDGKTFLIVPHWPGQFRTAIYFHDTATGEPVDYRKRVAALPKIDAPR